MLGFARPGTDDPVPYRVQCRSCKEWGKLLWDYAPGAARFAALVRAVERLAEVDDAAECKSIIKSLCTSAFHFSQLSVAVFVCALACAGHVSKLAYTTVLSAGFGGQAARHLWRATVH